jgi:hypothetical protein
LKRGEERALSYLRKPAMADNVAPELHGVLAYLQAHGYEDAVNAILVQQQQQSRQHQSRQRGGSLR